MPEVSRTRTVAVLVTREVGEGVSLDDIHRRYVAVGRVVKDVSCFDLSAGNSAADRVALASLVLNADADLFSAIEGFAREAGR